MKDWIILREKLLQDPEVRAEYDKLEAEYQITRALIKARLEKNMTQAEVAQKAGVKQAYIARLEGGNANPTVESLNKVASVLGLHLKLA